MPRMPTASKPRSAIFRTAELAVGGDLRTHLRVARRNGKTFADIATDFREVGVVVTYEAVRVWCQRLGVK